MKFKRAYLLINKTLTLFEKAKTFGSLIQVDESDNEPLNALLKTLKHLVKQGDSTKQKPAAQKLLPFIKQACLLAQKYDAVVANPPYMGGKYLAVSLKKHLKENYKGYEKDLFSAFIIRNLQLTKENGQLGFMTPFVWMFISSYEQLRSKLVNEDIISTLIQLEYSGFDGATVPICTFTLTKGHIPDYTGSYIKLSDFKGHKNQAPKTLEAIKNPECGWFYEAKPDDFKKIPSSPIAYWVSDNVRNIFNDNPSVKKFSKGATGLQTSNSDRFLRYWHEIEFKNRKWVRLAKGGTFRKWAGNVDYVVNWKNNGIEIKEYISDKYPYLNGNYSLVVKNEGSYFSEGLLTSRVTSGSLAFRYKDKKEIYSDACTAIFPEDTKYFLGLLSSKLTSLFQKLNPTINFQAGDVEKIPVIESQRKGDVINFVNKLIEISKYDWNTYETSWDFQSNPLIVGWAESNEAQHINAENNAGLRDKAANPAYTLADIYVDWQTQNQKTITEMQALEQENNRLFIDAYGLQDELTPDVPLQQITLTVNPQYRYGGKLSDSALAERFQSDTLAELISYAIGCMMGRYRLDKAGLIYAHAGNKDFDRVYRSHAPRGNESLDAPRPETESRMDDIAKSTMLHDAERLAMHSHAERGNDVLRFEPDDDGIIPLTDQEWFADDATHRFREFVRVVWGEDNLQTNLDFVTESLCLYAIKAKSSESSLETIRRYLSTQFYKDHLKTYKKRPIYWLFSSGKQKAFECLVYLHRYNESTLSRMRTEYVTSLLGKYEASAMVLEKQMQDASSTAEANRFKKSLTALEKKQTELSEFDDKLKHYADMRISLDLDDGVKVNYGKFGDLLVDVKAVTGKK